MFKARIHFKYAFSEAVAEIPAFSYGICILIPDALQSRFRGRETVIPKSGIETTEAAKRAFGKNLN